VPEEMVCNEVVELGEADQEQIVGLGDSEADGFVEVDDTEVLRYVRERSELPDDVAFILFELFGSVGVREEDCASRTGEGNHPFPVSLDRFGKLCATSCGVEGDVDLTNRLGKAVVGFKRIVTGVDLVKIDKASEEDIVP
jgi:hypothetical protein